MNVETSNNKSRVFINRTNKSGTIYSNGVMIKISNGYVEVSFNDSSEPPTVYKQTSDMSIVIDHKTKEIKQKYKGVLHFTNPKPKNINFKKFINFLINWFK